MSICVVMSVCNDILPTHQSILCNKYVIMSAKKSIFQKFPDFRKALEVRELLCDSMHSLNCIFGLLQLYLMLLLQLEHLINSKFDKFKAEFFKDNQKILRYV